MFGREHEPFAGELALPSGPVEVDESMEDAVTRHLASQLGLSGLAHREQLETSLAWLHEQARDSRCIDVLACHDAGVSPQLIQVC